MNKVPKSKVKFTNANLKTEDVPIIGERTKEMQEIAEGVMEKALQNFGRGLNPIIENLTMTIDNLERRLSVVEEVKQIVPPKIEVVVKHENTSKET